MGTLGDIMRMRKTTATGLIDVSVDDDLSAAIYIGPHRSPVELVVDTWDASTITIEGSDDGVTYRPVWTSDGTNLQAFTTPSAGDAASGFRYGFTSGEQVMLAGPSYLKVGAGTGQGSDVNITFVCLPIAG